MSNPHGITGQLSFYLGEGSSAAVGAVLAERLDDDEYLQALRFFIGI